MNTAPRKINVMAVVQVFQKDLVYLKSKSQLLPIQF